MDLRDRINRLSAQQRAAFEDKLARRVESVLPTPSVLRATQPGRAYPLSSAQRRIWFQEKWLPGSQLGNVPNPIRLRGPLEPDSLRRACDEVVRRHEILRTTFHETPDGPVQIAGVPRPMEWHSQLVEPESDAQAEEEIRRILNEESRRPFDLEKELTVRATLVRRFPDSHVLILTFHHIVCDVTTVAILLQEIADLYRAYRQGQPSPLAEPALQYGDYVVWEQQWLKGPDCEAQWNYWKDHLSGCPGTLTLPTGRKRPPVQDPRGATIFFEFSPECMASVQSLRSHGITAFRVFLAAYAAVLHRWSGQPDVVIGTAVTNRTRPEFQTLPGYFLNTVALRFRFPSEISVENLLEQVRQVTSGALLHQEFPFDLLLERLALSPDPSRTPLFQAVFLVQGAPEASVRFDGLECGVRSTSTRGPSSALDVDAAAAKFDLQFGVLETDEQLHFRGALNYATALFNAPMAVRIVEDIQQMVMVMSELPSALISDVRLSGPGPSTV